MVKRKIRARDLYRLYFARKKVPSDRRLSWLVMTAEILPWVNEPAIFYCLFTNLVAACSYLIDLLLNKADIPLIRYPFFWMASGELIFCCVYAMIPPLLHYYMKISYAYFMVYSLVANTFMYGGFIACFLCFRRTRSLVNLRVAR